MQVASDSTLVESGPIPGIEQLWDPEFNIVLNNISINSEDVENLLDKLVLHWTTPPNQTQSVREWSIEKLGITEPPKTYEALVEIEKDRMRDLANMLFHLTPI